MLKRQTHKSSSLFYCFLGLILMAFNGFLKAQYPGKKVEFSLDSIFSKATCIRMDNGNIYVLSVLPNKGTCGIAGNCISAFTMKGSKIKAFYPYSISPKTKEKEHNYAQDFSVFRDTFILVKDRGVVAMDGKGRFIKRWGIAGRTESGNRITRHYNALPAVFHDQGQIIVCIKYKELPEKIIFPGLAFFDLGQGFFSAENYERGTLKNGHIAKIVQSGDFAHPLAGTMAWTQNRTRKRIYCGSSIDSRITVYDLKQEKWLAEIGEKGRHLGRNDTVCNYLNHFASISPDSNAPAPKENPEIFRHACANLFSKLNSATYGQLYFDENEGLLLRVYAGSAGIKVPRQFPYTRAYWEELRSKQFTKPHSLQAYGKDGTLKWDIPLPGEMEIVGSTKTGIIGLFKDEKVDGRVILRKIRYKQLYRAARKL